FRERRTNAKAVTNPVAGRRARAPGARRRRVADKTVPVSRGAYRITTKDDSGGLEVILDVYFPPHVTSL
ncbi:hypothetical protein U9M48_006476, partial [Paspalum notatum var. saurae]